MCSLKLINKPSNLVTSFDIFLPRQFTSIDRASVWFTFKNVQQCSPDTPANLLYLLLQTQFCFLPSVPVPGQSCHIPPGRPPDSRHWGMTRLCFPPRTLERAVFFRIHNTEMNWKVSYVSYSRDGNSQRDVKIFDAKDSIQAPYDGWVPSRSLSIIDYKCAIVWSCLDWNNQEKNFWSLMKLMKPFKILLLDNKMISFYIQSISTKCYKKAQLRPKLT